VTTTAVEPSELDTHVPSVHEFAGSPACVNEISDADLTEFTARRSR